MQGRRTCVSNFVMELGAGLLPTQIEDRWPDWQPIPLEGVRDVLRYCAERRCVADRAPGLRSCNGCLLGFEEDVAEQSLEHEDDYEAYWLTAAELLASMEPQVVDRPPGRLAVEQPPTATVGGIRRPIGECVQQALDSISLIRRRPRFQGEAAAELREAVVYCAERRCAQEGGPACPGCVRQLETTEPVEGQTYRPIWLIAEHTLHGIGA